MAEKGLPEIPEQKPATDKTPSSNIPTVEEILNETSNSVLSDDKPLPKHQNSNKKIWLYATIGISLLVFIGTATFIGLKASGYLKTGGEDKTPAIAEDVEKNKTYSPRSDDLSEDDIPVKLASWEMSPYIFGQDLTKMFLPDDEISVNLLKSAQNQPKVIEALTVLPSRDSGLTDLKADKNKENYTYVTRETAATVSEYFAKALTNPVFGNWCKMQTPDWTDKDVEDWSRGNALYVGEEKASLINIVPTVDKAKNRFDNKFGANQKCVWFGEPRLVEYKVSQDEAGAYKINADYNVKWKAIDKTGEKLVKDTNMSFELSYTAKQGAYSFFVMNKLAFVEAPQK